MKRLVRNGKLISSFNHNGNYYEIISNPTKEEINDIKKEDQYDSVRGIIYDDGYIIIWPGSILHGEINRFIDSPINMNNCLNFACYRNSWTIDGHGQYRNFIELAKKIISHKDILNNIGNISNEFNLYLDTAYNDRIVGLKIDTMINDIKSLSNNEDKIAIKNKKAKYYDSFKKDEKYYETFINPSLKEINDIKENDQYGSIRGIIQDDGTLIIWPGSILHDEINRYTKKEINVFNGVLRFAFDSSVNVWIFDCYNFFDIFEISKKIKENQSILSKIGNINGTLSLFFIKNENEDVKKLSIKDINKIVEKDFNNVANKRLIKKSEFFDYYKDTEDNQTYEVFINPTNEQIQKVKKQSGYDSIRGVIYDDGTLIVWPGHVLHDFINRQLYEKNIDVNNTLRFSYEGNKGWIFDSHKMWETKELSKKIKEHEQQLNKIGDLNQKIFIFNSTDRDPSGFYFNQMDEQLESMGF